MTIMEGSWMAVGWHDERWVAWVVCCCEVAFAPVPAHAWMDGWMVGYGWMSMSWIAVVGWGRL